MIPILHTHTIVRTFVDGSAQLICLFESFLDLCIRLVSLVCLAVVFNHICMCVLPTKKTLHNSASANIISQQERNAQQAEMCSYSLFVLLSSTLYTACGWYVATELQLEAFNHSTYLFGNENSIKQRGK